MTTSSPEALAMTGAAFQRENRYIVIKRKHLRDDQEIGLRRFLRHQLIEPVECVVIESDWPEYETVWQMIEARVTGRPTPSGEVVQASIPRPPLELEPQVRAVSQRLLTHMRGIARQDGWALGVHGSMARDLDIIAVPWTDDATNADAFVEAMRAAVARELSGQCFIQNIDGKRRVDEKPNGRCAFTLYALSSQLVQSEAGAHPFIDLSIMDFRDHRIASSGAGEPVTWMYHWPEDPGRTPVFDRKRMHPNALGWQKGWTETPLYALATPPHLPPAEPVGADSLVEALEKIANPPVKNGFQEMAMWMQGVAKAALQ